jgi:PKD repeat protein
MFMRSLFIFLLLFSAAIGHSQDEVLFCGQTEQTQRIFERFPHLHQNIAESEQELEEFTAQRGAGGDDVYIIPVVFHIIHENGPENISDEQVYSAMEVLNRDFRMENEDIDDVVDAFQDITADIDIEFRLARKDPNGACTKGINRIFSPLTNEGGEDMKNLIQWPRDMYLNVWVCAYANGSAGYTYLPGSVNNWQMQDEDGIVLKHNYCGEIGTSSVSSSRTLTHECGHWLNLRHCWGNGNSPAEPDNCDMDDNVSDTPLTLGWTSCSLSGQSCGSLDNVQNYMEYSYCSRMFTQGQRNRMRSAAESSVADRNELWTESNLFATGVTDDPGLCVAEFYAPRTVVCVGDSVPFFDDSFHDPESWEWSFGDGSVFSGSDPEVYQNPYHVYQEAGLYSVGLTVGDGMDEQNEIKQNFIQVLPEGHLEHPFVESFEGDFMAEDWFVYDLSGNENWEETDNAAVTGSHCLRIENLFSEYDDIDQLVSATYDASGFDEIEISYKWAFAPKVNLTDDMLRVYVSGDCGENWWVKAIHRGFTDLPSADAQNSYFTPGTWDWDGHSIVISNPELLTSNMRVMFEFRAKGGNNMYLDDINIIQEGWVGIEDHLMTGASMNIFPNPTSENTSIVVDLDQSGALTLDIVNAVGQLVETVRSSNLNAGVHTFDVATEQWPGGVYVVRLQSGTAILTRRLIVR